MLPASALAQVGQTHAFLVGVQDYSGNLPKLRFARSDIQSFAALLKKNGVPAENIEVLHDDHRSISHPKYLAESSKIRQRLALFLDGLSQADSVIVAFAGHGVQRKDERRNYFCPLDSDLRDLLKPVAQRRSLVSLGEVYGQLAACKAGRKLLLVDACRDEPDLKKIASRSIRKIDLDKVDAFNGGSAPKGNGIAAVFSCAAGQQSFEDAGLGHGVFFHHVMQAWSPSSAGPDGKLDFLEFALRTRSLTSAYARKIDRAQTPHIINDLEGAWSLPLSAELSAGTLMTNSLGMKLAYIPAGDFLMGSPASEKDRLISETQHRVKLTQSFYLGVHEVTQGEWKTLMGDEPWKGKEHVKEDASFPATYINWNDTVKFCDALTKRERAAGRITPAQSYRLPAEAEWEYACRAGTVTAYSFGDNSSRLSDYGWWGGLVGDGNAKSEKYAHNVGLKKPNGWGLYDMHGNVYEWCSDLYGNYQATGATNPKGAVTGSNRVYRGGCWSFSARHARSASRNWHPPEFQSYSLGFRLLLSPAEPSK